LGTVNDVPEVIRLAKLLWDDMDLPQHAGEWEDNAGLFFERALDDGSTRLLVADDPNDLGSLVATGIALIYQQTPAYWLPNGKMGYVQWFYTASQWRRQGLAGEILDDFIDWFRRNDVLRVQLHSSADAVSFYEAKGFEPTMYGNYWLHLPG
jgi:GNAT superfamily N-acetyltransferase